MPKRKKKDEIEIEITTSRSVTFGLGIMFWDQLVKVASEIMNRDIAHEIPDHAEVTFQGESICVDWDD
jgi:hypothetical protein